MTSRWGVKFLEREIVILAFDRSFWCFISLRFVKIDCISPGSFKHPGAFFVQICQKSLCYSAYACYFIVMLVYYLALCSPRFVKIVCVTQYMLIMRVWMGGLVFTIH